jgi:hypothetical protein
MQRGKEESAEGEGERTHRGGGGRADARGKKDVPLFYLNFILFSSRDSSFFILFLISLLFFYSFYLFILSTLFFLFPFFNSSFLIFSRSLIFLFFEMRCKFVLARIISISDYKDLVRAIITTYSDPCSDTTVGFVRDDTQNFSDYNQILF